MREEVEAVLRGEDAWVVGGAVRDELLGLPVFDLDVACREPEQAARALMASAGDAVFPLSTQFGAWRVVLDRSHTVDFSPLQGGSIERDLAARDFTVNAMAVPLAGGEPLDPFGGRADLERRILRPVSGRVFDDDPLRLFRAVRLEDELGFRLDTAAEELVRAKEFTKGRLRLELESTNGVSFWLAYQELLIGSIKTIEEEVALVDAITAEDVRRVANDVLRAPIQMAVVGPFAKDLALRAAVGA